MVQCSMTLRGHNPHDSQVRMEGYRMSVIVSHVCEVLHETHKKGFWRKDPMDISILRFQPFNFGESDWNPPLPSTFIIRVAMMQKVTSK